jgi:hypothetical protein
MHTKWNVNRSVRNVLCYHERKVRLGQAECLYAGNMIKDTIELSLQEKRFFIERLETLNDRVERKTLHIFISFPRKESPDNETVRNLGKDYMKGMGLGDQPYLIYRHWDAVHDHIHIVTSGIKNDGTKIDIWQGNLIRSFQLSRQLERKYGLYQAGRPMPDDEWARQHPVKKIEYGVSSLKPAINAVLDKIIPNYKYSSLDDLNVLLAPYQLKASTGNPDGPTYRHGGLLFYPLNKNGEREQVCYRASTLRQKPTLRNLQVRFEANRTLREPFRRKVTTAIDWAMAGKAPTLDGFKALLEKQRIGVALQKDGERAGRIWYIDQSSQSVFDGEGLGERYNAPSLLQRFKPDIGEEQRLKEQLNQKKRLRLELS